MWERTIDNKYILAASVERKFLLNLKFAKMNFTLLLTFLMWVLKLSFESVCSPTYYILWQPETSLQWWKHLVSRLCCFLRHTVYTYVFDRLSCRRDWLSQAVTNNIASVSLVASSSDVFPWPRITVSSAYFKVSHFSHTDGRLLMYLLNRFGPSTEPCRRPVDNRRGWSYEYQFWQVER